MDGKYYALIIGINNYKYLSRLNTAVNDAKEVERMLKEKYSFETKTLYDDQATRNNIIGALNDFRKQILPEDKLLIYYAGHGYFNADQDKSYWLPINAKSDEDTEWIISDSITASLKIIPAKHIMIVADSCFSGTLTRKAGVDLSTREARKAYLEKMLNKKARVLMASGGNEPVADSGGGEGHSIFAKAFLNALKDINQDVFTAEELFIKGGIKESVAGNAEQTPEVNIIRNSGHDGGDFVFQKK